MTFLQFFGAVALAWLLEDLVRWVRIPRVAPTQRRWHLRHATMGLVPALCLGAMWAIFFAQERQTPGAPSLAPTWLQVCALGFLLSILGWLFVDVVMTVRAVRGGI